MLIEDADERCRRISAFYDEAPHATAAHPTPEHILPAAVVAGAVALPPNDSGNPLAAKEIYDGWIRGSMSLACYRFDNVRRTFFDGVFNASDRPESTESAFSRPLSQ
jgi:aromatic ring-opening dioxygenase catalytic subunit (LigB family)